MTPEEEKKRQEELYRQRREDEELVRQTAEEANVAQETPAESAAATKTADEIQAARNAELQAKIKADAAKLAENKMVQTSVEKTGQGEVSSPDEYHAIKMEDYKSIAQYAEAVDNRIKEEKARAQQQEQANMLSSMGTGFAELGAGLINMFAVGGLNASPQQYHAYNQDWMKKADDDIRENRKRRESMSDLRDRINLQLQQVRTQGRLDEWNYKRQQEKEQALAEYQRDQTDLKRQQLAQQAAVAASREARERALTEEKIRSSRSADQRAWAKQRSDERRLAANGGGGGKTGGDNYHVVIDGKDVVLRMSKQSYEQAIQSGTSYLKKDIMESAGFNGSWRDFANKVNSDKKGKTYSDDIRRIVAAIDGTDDDAADSAAIARYVKDNSDSVNRFNSHLALSSDSSSGYGDVEEEEAAAAPSAGVTSREEAASGGIADELRGISTPASQGSSIASDVSGENKAAESAPKRSIGENELNELTISRSRNALIDAAEKSGDENLKKMVSNASNLYRLLQHGMKVRTEYGGKHYDDSLSDAENIIRYAGFSKLLPYIDDAELEEINNIIQDGGSMDEESFRKAYNLI